MELSIDTKHEIRKYLQDYVKVLQDNGIINPFASRSFEIFKQILKEIEKEEFNKE